MEALTSAAYVEQEAARSLLAFAGGKGHHGRFVRRDASRLALRQHLARRPEATIGLSKACEKLFDLRGAAILGRFSRQCGCRAKAQVMQNAARSTLDLHLSRKPKAPTSPFFRSTQ